MKPNFWTAAACAAIALPAMAADLTYRADVQILLPFST